MDCPVVVVIVPLARSIVSFVFVVFFNAWVAECIMRVITGN